MVQAIHCKHCESNARENATLKGRVENLQTSLMRFDGWLPRTLEERVKKAEFMLSEYPERFQLLDCVTRLIQYREQSEEQAKILRNLHLDYGPHMMKMRVEIKERDKRIAELEREIKNKNMLLESEVRRVKELERAIGKYERNLESA